MVLLLVVGCLRFLVLQSLLLGQEEVLDKYKMQTDELVFTIYLSALKTKWGNHSLFGGGIFFF